MAGRPEKNYGARERLLAQVRVARGVVDVQLYAQTVLGREATAATAILMRFLVTLPVGAFVGGVAASRLGNPVVAVAGIMYALTGLARIPDGSIWQSRQGYLLPSVDSWTRVYAPAGT